MTTQALAGVKKEVLGSGNPSATLASTKKEVLSAVVPKAILASVKKEVLFRWDQVPPGYRQSYSINRY